ncbi:TIGR02677 family protein [Nocardia sp. JW2]|uniref:TIGR02677 family protein n=1 Tax=Nocardia sp. JW2 TaxID=3450738 RepID=UPI003F43B5E6
MTDPGAASAHLDLFRYLAADERMDYIAIMSRFTASLLADMSAATVVEQLEHEGFSLSQDTIEARCKQLVRWGNLVPSLRDARVSTVQDYLRARSRYQVSSLGGRVHRGAIEIIEAADGAREVARELLGEIADSLSEVVRLLDVPRSADRADKLAGVVTTIFNNQRLFTASVTDFYAYIAGVLSRFDLHGDEYAQFKGLLLDYVDLITADVNRHAPLIAERLATVSRRLDDLLSVLDSVARLELGDLGTVERSGGRDRLDWDQLLQWYTGSGQDSGPAQLRAAAGQALGQLLANAKRMLHSTSTGYSRRADLLRLAAWFQHADDVEAHQLFAATFGMWSTRHLSLGPEEPDARVGPMTSWLVADPIDVPVSLRERGSRAAKGRSARVPDISRDRAMVEASVRQEAERNAMVAAELSAAGYLDGAQLSPQARATLLDELARLLAADTDSVTNHDLGVVLHAVPGGSTTIISPDGSLFVDGYQLSCRPVASTWGEELDGEVG